MADDDDRAYWKLMGHESSKEHALRAWQDSYLASCKLPESEQRIVDAELHKRYPWRHPEPDLEPEERDFRAEQQERYERGLAAYNLQPRRRTAPRHAVCAEKILHPMRPRIRRCMTPAERPASGEMAEEPSTQGAGGGLVRLPEMARNANNPAAR